jgi:geranylgeranyl pyrophosphate synthase
MPLSTISGPPNSTAALVDAAVGAVAAGERALVAEAALPAELTALVLTVLSAPGNSLGGADEPRWARFPLLAYASATAGEALTAVIPLAVATEILAAAHGLLDDLEDGDASPVMGDAAPAVVLNVTAALFTLGQLALLAVPAAVSRVLVAGWLGVCGGQHLDLTADFGGAEPLGAALQIAEAKSATIVGATLEAGALLGGVDPALAAGYRQFGHAIGLAGQLANDLRGLAPVPDGATDLSRRRLTPPIAFALQQPAAGSVRALVHAGRGAGPVDPVRHHQALVEVAGCGAYQYTWLLLQHARRAARVALAAIARSRSVAGTLDRLLAPLPGAEETPR